MAGVLVVCGALLVISIVGLALRKGCRADGVYQNDSPHFGSVESYGAIGAAIRLKGVNAPAMVAGRTLTQMADAILLAITAIEHA